MSVWVPSMEGHKLRESRISSPVSFQNGRPFSEVNCHFIASSSQVFWNNDPVGKCLGWWKIIEQVGTIARWACTNSSYCFCSPGLQICVVFQNQQKWPWGKINDYMHHGQLCLSCPLQFSSGQNGLFPTLEPLGTIVLNFHNQSQLFWSSWLKG